MFGSGPRGERMRAQVREAFSEVISIANARAADLTLIVGDLFDSARVSEEALAFALADIARARMPVVMIPGNHDAHDERSIYAALPQETLPRNLHLILEEEGRLLHFRDLAARVWGRAMVEHTPNNRPLAGIPPREPGQWNIALAHGYLLEEGDYSRSSPITPEEIAASAYDYIALGHVHVFSDVSRGTTRAFYCGTPAPLYAGENAGWVAYVTCVPGEVPTVERLPVGRVADG